LLSELPTPTPDGPAGAEATRTLCFVGVTTGGSSIMSLFPRWASLLELDATIRGHDLPLAAAPERYREVIAELAADPTVAGALVTTHKAAVFDHARDLFAWLDPHAQRCREISCIARRGDRLEGWAKDPITAELALDHLLGSDRLNALDGDAVCFGAGGAGLAIAVCLLTRPRAPRRVVLVDIDARRLELARRVHGELGAEAELVCVVSDGTATNDALVSAAAPGSLIINATGMGKDLPGSPISGAARFPENAVAWDLNYRGELEFLRIADAQSSARGLQVADGWRYFLHGWTEVIAEVFQIELTPDRFDAMAAAAEHMNTGSNR
jgi:shikimate dehydrogenase